MKIKIFFSWQSADTKHNKNFISSCLSDAVKKIKQHPNFKNIEFEITDAVRNEVGQIAIADTIIDQIIPDCDIFIADLTSQKIWHIIHFFTGSRPMPNPNVMTEYGVALNSLGKQRILSVINTSTNGSPKKNEEIIPFDIRHDRFPTEFHFSKKNETQKVEIKKSFVNDLVTALRPTIQNVLETQKSKFSPFIVWNELNELLKKPKAGKFIESEKFEEIKSNILNIKNESPIRILGLSGLGKTRIVFEIFRPENDNNDSLLFANRLLYVNCNDYQEKINFVELISKIAKNKKDSILLADNCDLETHRLIARNLKDLAFISIDSNPEENLTTEGINYIIIGKNDLSNVVTEIVDNDFQEVGKENIEKIKEFSQGIPLMAVLLADSISNGERFVGKLNDKELLDKLLGTKGKEQEWRSILKSCSMFSYIGFEKEAAIQYKFIATNENITISNNSQQVRLSTFLDVINHFKEREIFEKQGRFLSIRPLPLAMALAVEWLESCSSERLLQVISDISNLAEPDRKLLINSLSDQMKYLGYNDRAVEIVEKIVGPESPFDNAEVLNTELGSRLFRSFVEVNPVAVAENFKRIFYNKTTQDLYQIIEGRRNLVWILEKLCFDKRTFSSSSKILLNFAVAENETWANNATGQFLQLFNTHLAGTEADLNERWSIIDWALNQGGKHYALAINAMQKGLNFGHFNRMGGAEQQGTKRLIDNNPTWHEIQVYWNNILNKLFEIIQLENEYSDIASETIANNTRTIFRVKMGDLILPHLVKISEFKKNDWDNGLRGLKHTVKYEKKSISETQLEQIENLIEKLTKRDFVTRYITLSTCYYLDRDETYSSAKLTSKIIEFADEYIKSDISWEDTLPQLYKNQRVNSYLFGKRIFELLKEDKSKIDHFLNLSLKIISEIPEKERNLSTLGGFVTSSTVDVKKEFYSNLFHSKEFSNLLFYFIPIDVSGYDHFDLLFKLIDAQICNLSNFYSFGYSNALSTVSLNQLIIFSEQLFAYGDEGYELVFDLFYDLGYGDEVKKASLLPMLKKCIVKLGFSRKFQRQLDDYKWSETVSSIISNPDEVAFAKFVNRSIIDSITWENSYHLDYSIQNIYGILLRIHFNSIWNELSDALLSIDNEYVKFYSLKDILGSSIGGSGGRKGILFEGDIESIFVWCEKNKPLAASRLAELVPIFENNNSDYSQWNPLALRLLNEYGEIEEVLSNLSSNMGTYFWAGSVVPFLESKQQLFQQIHNHKIEEVRAWANLNIEYLAKDIEREKDRDAERFIR
jgi:hypothetical protein